MISLLPFWNSGRYFVTGSSKRSFPSANNFMMLGVVATTFVREATSKMVSVVIASMLGTRARFP